MSTSSPVTRIAQLEPREKPDAATIIREIKDAITSAQAIGAFDKVTTAHQTRRCLWAGQSADGMLAAENAFPWQGAIDSRVPLADEIVSDHVRIRMKAVRAGNVQIGPQNEIEDSPKAKTWNDVLRYYHNQRKRDLHSEQKLFYTCVEEIGYGVMKIDWRDEKRLKPIEITVEQLTGALVEKLKMDFAQEAEIDPAALPPEIVNRLADEAAMKIEEMVMDPAQRAEFITVLTAYDPTMPESEAKKIAPKLAKERTAAYYAPRSVGGLPCYSARVPWVNCGHALDLNAKGKASWWFDAEWLSEVDLRIRCEQAGADEKWLEEVLKQENKGLVELMQSGGVTVPDWLLNGVGIGLSFDRHANNGVKMYQILTVYRLAVNEAGIPACYETLVSPHVTELYGKHECCEVTELPFVAEAREPAALMIQSRGIPEIVLTSQLAIKKLTDSTTAAAELAAFPPYRRALGDNNKLAPGTEINVARNTGTSGRDNNSFLDVPGVDEGALKAMDMHRADVDRLFVRGKFAAENPDSRQTFVDDLGYCAVLSYEEMTRLLWLHIQAYVSNVKASRIAGRPVNVEATAEDLEGTADVNVEFSALAFNQKTALELAEYMTKLAGLDKSGRIDFGKGVELITRIFDPVLSENIIMPGEAASAETEKDEQGVIAAIASGQYVTGHTNSPQARWQVLQRWLANPATTAMLQSQPVVYACLQEHVKGLQQEMVQNTTNVFTGQTGQSPHAPWEQQQQPEQALEMMVGGGRRAA